MHDTHTFIAYIIYNIIKPLFPEGAILYSETLAAFKAATTGAVGGNGGEAFRGGLTRRVFGAQ